MSIMRAKVRTAMGMSIVIERHVVFNPLKPKLL
jgi:hypothetical protein